LGGEGLSACSGDILLESLIACAGITLGQIARRWKQNSGIMPTMKYWEIIARTSPVQPVGRGAIAGAVTRDA
jgi:hypothetical protein